MKLAAKIKAIEFECIPDSCINQDKEPTMKVEFDNAGGGTFVRIESANLMSFDAEDVVPFSGFLEWVCEQNDRLDKEMK